MKKINVLRLLKEQGFRYVFFHPNRRIVISTHKPKLSPTMKCWEHEDGGTLILLGYAPAEFEDWRNSVQELDFGDSKQEVQKPLFEVGDVVYVLSHSNSGAFGVSSKGEIVKENTESFRVRLDTGFHESHKKSNISFIPFSIYQAGFSQVRPKPEPKNGDWGWFWDNDDDIEDGYRYAMFNCMNGRFFMASNSVSYCNFSLENPVKHD